MSRRVEVEAPAKLNLLLRVLGRRDDGFHDIETLFQAIDLADDVAVEVGGTAVDLDLSGADLGPVEENLAFKAALRARASFGLRHGLRVELMKRIPAGAGLGGGSSDAAAVLACVAQLAGIPRSDPRLREIGAELGSDVAFFLGASPLAAGRGRGEVLEPLPPLPSADLVLVSPPVHVASGEAYGALAAARREGRAPAAARGVGTPQPPPRSWSEVAARAHNDFEGVIAERHPEIARATGALHRRGANLAMMTGSGSTSFGLFASRAEAEEAARSLEQELGWPCRAARSLGALPTPRPG